MSGGDGYKGDGMWGIDGCGVGRYGVEECCADEYVGGYSGRGV